MNVDRRGRGCGSFGLRRLSASAAAGGFPRLAESGPCVQSGPKTRRHGKRLLCQLSWVVGLPDVEDLAISTVGNDGVEVAVVAEQDTEGRAGERKAILAFAAALLAAHDSHWPGQHGLHAGRVLKPRRERREAQLLWQALAELQSIKGGIFDLGRQVGRSA